MIKTTILLVVTLMASVFSPNGMANLCSQIRNDDNPSDTDSALEADMHESLFSERDYHGNRNWNRKILICNRKRDDKGDEVKKIMTKADYAAQKAVLSQSNLSQQLIAGKYNFFGQVALQQKYRYVLSKSAGVWTMTIPYDAEINDRETFRIDFFMGWLSPDEPDYSSVDKTHHAWQLYAIDQVDTTGIGANAIHTLKSGARPIAETHCATTTFYKGRENKYDNQNNLQSKKRDRENRHISEGKIQYSYSDASWKDGCRVNRFLQVHWRPDPASNRVESASSADTWILRNFVQTAETYWSEPANFRLKILIKGFNDEDHDRSLINLLGNSDYLKIRFGTKFMPYGGNQIYKTSLIQFNNFSTMTTDATYWHEVGHAFGLDDEYGGENKKTGAKENGCENSEYARFNAIDYQMCVAGNSTPKSIYHYIATSRYVMTQICSDDTDCGLGQYCNNRLGLNRCLVDGTALMGESCTLNRECATNRCQGSGDNKQCACANDNDCGANSICMVGTLSIGQNSCRATASTSCPSGWSYETRNPFNKDRCNRVVTQTAALKCKLLATDKAKNWTGPHAQSGRDECRSKKGKKPKDVKCPSGFALSVRSGADGCAKSVTEHREPTCPSGWDYKSQNGRDLCQDK